ncbi:MAG TPA: hypothetical protein VJ201_02505 [Candidatus Babeliales bacterium]|nr:hypothetical protein [Candidatus Babeliales bacterium]
MKIKFLVLLKLSILFFFLNTFAIDGDLDLSFGKNEPTNPLQNTGKIITSFNDDSSVNGMALQKDGKIIVAGFAGTTPHFALARYNIDGTLDKSFGATEPTNPLVGTGKIITKFSDTSSDIISSIKIQNDGKIIVAGVSNFGRTQNFALARYNINGTLDTTFGATEPTNPVSLQGTGKIILKFNRQDSSAEDLAIQLDGKIIIVGGVGKYPARVFGGIQLNSDGVMDKKFGTKGIITTDIRDADLFAKRVVIDKNKKIIVIGQARINGNLNFAIMRYHSDGSLDISFGANEPTNPLKATGKIISSFGGTIDVARDIVLQKDGKIVVGGQSNAQKLTNFAFARYNDNGNLDHSFGENGKVLTKLSSGSLTEDACFSLKIQLDGKILAAGSSAVTNSSNFGLVRYGKNGLLDKTFGSNQTGIVLTSFDENSKDQAGAIIIQGDGKIIVSGQSTPAKIFNKTSVAGNGIFSSFAIAKYESTVAPCPLPVPRGLTSNLFNALRMKYVVYCQCTTIG